MDISGTITECKSHVILVIYYLFYFYGTKMNMTFSRGLRKASHSELLNLLFLFEHFGQMVKS